MKRYLLRTAAAMAIGAATGVAFAQDKGGDVPRKALSQLYPGAEVQSLEPAEDVNGVKVYNATVRTAEGSTFAKVTEYGDFLVSGAAAKAAAAPEAVNAVTEGMFRSAPEADALVETSYYVYLDTSKGQYHLRLDAAGRLRDAKTKQQAEQGDTTRRDQPEAESEHQRLAQAARSRFGDDIQLPGYFKWGNTPGLSVIQIEKNGKKGFVIVDAKNNIYSQRIGIDPNQLPEPVRRTVEEMFEGRIVGAERGEQQFWQFQQQVGDDTLTVKIRPTGEIAEINSESADRDDAKAVAASGSQGGPAAENERDRDRDRDRDESDRDRERRERRDRERRRDRDREPRQ